jgi:hypothetical protein
LIPACHPSGGARAAICSSVGVRELLAGVALVAIVDGADEAVVAASAAPDDTAGAALEGPGVVVSALIAFCCAEKVVEAIGQPTPGPSRFCRVTAAAFNRAL